jgi:hypothetical protein
VATWRMPSGLTIILAKYISISNLKILIKYDFYLSYQFCIAKYNIIHTILSNNNNKITQISQIQNISIYVYL